MIVHVLVKPMLWLSCRLKEELDTSDSECLVWFVLRLPIHVTSESFNELSREFGRGPSCHFENVIPPVIPI